MHHSTYCLSSLRNLVAYNARTVGYTCYGFAVTTAECPSQLSFKAERREPWGSYYALGNGYRFYSSVLMRFNSPDSDSPFAKGGLNVYAYCAGDPVNLVDRNGHWPTRAPSPSLSRSPPASRMGTPPARPRNPVARRPEGSRSRDASLSSSTSSLSGDERGPSLGRAGDSTSVSRSSSVSQRSQSLTSDDQRIYPELDHGLSDSDQDVPGLHRGATPALEHRPNEVRPDPAPRSRIELYLLGRQANTPTQQVTHVRRSSSPSR